ncbi:MAG: helix-turn-helix domain-containing protein [Cyanobacteria bacterium RI_101]|nr:helix-turn-helix domain-containing protein [Cyanobacteria bacterium RI_101]
MSNPLIVKKRFATVDALEAAYSQQPNFQVIQLAPGQLNCQIYRLALNEGVFEFRSIDTPLRILGEKTSDFLTFEFILSPLGGKYLSHGFSLTPETLYGFDPSRGIDLVLPKKTLMGTLIIRRQVFESYARLMGRIDLDSRFLSQNYVQHPITFGPVQDYLRELYGLVKNRDALLDHAAIHRLLLEDYLPLLIQSIPPSGKPKQKPPPFLRRSRIVLEVEAYLLNHLRHPITLQELCERFYVSKSPLTSGFQEMVGMSPLAYLKILRLHAIRRVLKSAPPKTKLASLMQEFGFWHAGRFSLDYKALFGESPSETLKK